MCVRLFNGSITATSAAIHAVTGTSIHSFFGHHAIGAVQWHMVVYAFVALAATASLWNRTMASIIQVMMLRCQRRSRLIGRYRNVGVIFVSGRRLKWGWIVVREWRHWRWRSGKFNVWHRFGQNNGTMWLNTKAWRVQLKGGHGTAAAAWAIPFRRRCFNVCCRRSKIWMLSFYIDQRNTYLCMYCKRSHQVSFHIWHCGTVAHLIPHSMGTHRERYLWQIITNKLFSIHSFFCCLITKLSLTWHIIKCRRWHWLAGRTWNSTFIWRFHIPMRKKKQISMVLL